MKKKLTMFFLFLTLHIYVCLYYLADLIKLNMGELQQNFVNQINNVVFAPLCSFRNDVRDITISFAKRTVSVTKNLKSAKEVVVLCLMMFAAVSLTNAACFHDFIKLWLEGRQYLVYLFRCTANQYF